VKQSSRHRHHAGFTLLEILLVITVAGIMAGLAVMSVGGNTEREFRRDVARIEQIMRLAADEAQFNAQELGLWIAADGASYGFYKFDTKKLKWVAYEQEGFRTEVLPRAYRMEIELQGESVDLAELYREVLNLDEKASGLGDKPFSPLLIFFSDGDYTPFRLWITHPSVKESVYKLEGDGLGDIHAEQVDSRVKPELQQDD
jgi:general secretion pathway protein H